jgi:hypothetical protein
LTPASIGSFQFRTPIRRKLEESEKHKRRFFSNDGRTNFWDFVGINFSLVKFLWANPLLVMDHSGASTSIGICQYQYWIMEEVAAD